MFDILYGEWVELYIYAYKQLLFIFFVSEKCLWGFVVVGGCLLRGGYGSCMVGDGIFLLFV